MENLETNIEQRLLLLAPLGRDAEVAAHVFRQAGLSCQPCMDFDDFILQLDSECGAAVVAEEAISFAGLPQLVEALQRQPAWSDVSLLVLTSGSSVAESSRRLRAALGQWANVSFIERPAHIVTLVTAAQAALRARRRQYETRDLLRQREEVLASILDAFATMDEEWRYTYVNPQACELSHCVEAEMLGKTMWEIFPSTVGTDLELRLREAMAGREPANFEWQAGSDRWLGLRVYPSGKGLAIFSVDISERKRAESDLERARVEAVEANRAKDQFLATLSHELRTPLTPVLMAAATLEMDPELPSALREQHAMIRRNVELEARIIDDLLDLTRITHGKLQLQMAPTDVHTLLDHTTEIVHSGQLNRRVSMLLHRNALQHHVRGDAARLQQVLWNLLKNAIKFTLPGGCVIVQTENPAPGVFQLIVADNGVGIAPEVLPRIFNAFEQGDATGQHRFGGLGLGLAISKAIVELHGGTIRAESPGRNLGARFMLELQTTEPPLALPGPAPAVAVGGSLRLLLVEDHEPTRAVLDRLLTRAGHRVCQAKDVQSALQAASAEHFDLVISDLGLPDGTGVELMSELRARHGLHGIALSGFGMDDDLRRSIEAGFSAHLVKPINFDRLRAVLSQFSRVGAPAEAGVGESTDAA